MSFIYFNQITDLIISIFVDDILFFWKKPEEIEKTKEMLGSNFEINAIEETCIGIQIMQLENGIGLYQPVYIKEILLCFDMLTNPPHQVIRGRNCQKRCNAEVEKKRIYLK